MSGPPTPLSVEVTRLPILLVTLGGERFEVEVFLHSGSDLHPGPETLGDRLNHPDGRFLPCECNGRVELFNRGRVAYVEHAGELPETARLDEVGAERVAAEIVLVSGETLTGELLYLLPHERRRVSDLFNRSERSFLLLTGAETTRYVNREAILRVRS